MIDAPQSPLTASGFPAAPGSAASSPERCGGRCRASGCGRARWTQDYLNGSVSEQREVEWSVEGWAASIGVRMTGTTASGFLFYPHRQWRRPSILYRRLVQIPLSASSD